MSDLSLPTTPSIAGKSWSTPEKWATVILGTVALIAGIKFADQIVLLITSLMVDVLHMGILGAGCAALGYLFFGKKPRLIYRTIMRSFLSMFCSIFPIQIIEDK